ncbi:BTAD domain-containing putative transcriptional regulator [Actinoplanes sp. CA-142083]|uniref:BTAD domain-containing putative transcriptional regulator n=1 Tax=Actinoplanes sp. CA-142083 TaxID=3239903 RepID=UPI003D8E7AB2
MTSNVRVDAFGDVLRRYRRRAGLTQEELARRSGLSTRGIRDLEKNRVATPHARSLRRLGDALSLSAEETAAFVPVTAAGPPPVAVSLLGPLTVTVGGRPVGSPTTRLLLGLLALRLGEVVPRDEIAELLWPGEPARARLAHLRAAVARLRKELQPADRAAAHPLRTPGHGLLLCLDPEQVDAARFAGLAERAAGRRGAAARSELLRRALTCWRGPVLADAPALVREHPAAQALRHQRIAAALGYADAERGPAAIDALRSVAAGEPLHEPVHAALVLALARSGDRAGALRLYGEIAGRLAGELGIAPGGRLVEAYQQAVADTGSRHPWVRPAQLPRDVRHFAGRREQLDALDGGSGITVVVGPPGSGKTALVVHWAHAVRDRFPDGQLFADLGGFGAGDSTRPDTVLRGFLHALGVPATLVPAEFEARGGLFRSLLAERRLLLVLDNVRSADHIRPLLPGAAGCRTLITSRDQLRDLVATADAESLTVGPLEPEHARKLIARRLGRARVESEPEAAAELTARCAGLPLALNVVAARAAATPGAPLAAVAAQLGPVHRMDELRDAFRWSSRGLSVDAARLLRLCGQAPAAPLSLPAAASLTGWPSGRARTAADELVRGHLFSVDGSGRYTSQDLLRVYAADLPGVTDPGPGRRRLLDHYLHTAYAAARLLDPHRRPIDLPPTTAGVSVEPPADAAAARAWLGAEHRTLVAAVEWAAGDGLVMHAWRLAWALQDHLDHPGRRHEWHAVERLALAAAVRALDKPAQAHAHRNLGRCCVLLGKRAEAEVHFRHAAQLCRAAGDTLGYAQTLAGLAELAPDAELALRHRLAALGLYRREGNAVEQARALGAVAWAYVRLGNCLEALDHGRRALAVNATVDDERGRAAIHDIIGHAHHRLGEYGEATRHLRRAMELRRAAGDPEPLVTVSDRLEPGPAGRP